MFKNNDLNIIFEELNKRNLENICNICKEEIHELDKINLKCGHYYHIYCIKTLKKNTFFFECPYCAFECSLKDHENKCTYEMRNKKICNKKCYNDAKLCTIHIKSKKKYKILKSKNIIIKINKLKSKINQLNQDINNLENELKNL